MFFQTSKSLWPPANQHDDLCVIIANVKPRTTGIDTYWKICVKSVFLFILLSSWGLSINDIFHLFISQPISSPCRAMPFQGYRCDKVWISYYITARPHQTPAPMHRGTLHEPPGCLFSFWPVAHVLVFFAIKMLITSARWLCEVTVWCADQWEL